MSERPYQRIECVDGPQKGRVGMDNRGGSQLVWDRHDGYRLWLDYYRIEADGRAFFVRSEPITEDWRESMMVDTTLLF